MRRRRFCEEVLDAPGTERGIVVGHHTGAVIAVEMAAWRPERAAPLRTALRPARETTIAAGVSCVSETPANPRG